MLNSVYGRLAINPTTKNTLIKRVEDNPGLLYHYDAYKIYKNIIMYEAEGKRTGKNVAGNICWASIVSSRGRSQLMRLMYRLELMGCEVVGVNTDSVSVRSDEEPRVDSAGFNQAIRFTRL